MHNLAPIDQREDLATKGYVDDAVGSVKAPYGLSVSSNLSSAGWYRILQLTADDANYANGRQGSQIDFTICRRGTNSRAESHAIRYHLINPNNNFSFEDSVTADSWVQLVTKIRHTRKDNVSYFDIYYVGTYTETVTVDMVIHDIPNKLSQYEEKDFVSVADAPSGETVLAYTKFTSNGYFEESLTGKSLTSRANTDLVTLDTDASARYVEGYVKIRFSSAITKCLVGVGGEFITTLHDGDYQAFTFLFPITASIAKLTTYLYDSASASIQSGYIRYRYV